MGKDNPNLIKNGGEGSKIGGWLRDIGRSDILEKAVNMVGDIATGDYLGAIKTLVKKDPDISPEQEKEANKLIELDYEDRAGARDMYKETDHKIADKIASSVIKWNLWVVFLAIVIEILVVIYIDDKVLIAIITGAISSYSTSLLRERQQIITFFFGSTMGSKRKTEIMNNK